jgi:hypothetical protein
MAIWYSQVGGRLTNSHIGSFSGRLEYDAMPNLDGVVGEAFIKSAQQSDIDGGCNAVRPFLLHEKGEQLLVKLVHLNVVATDLRGTFGITREHNIFGIVPRSTAILPISAK